MRIRRGTAKTLPTRVDPSYATRHTAPVSGVSFSRKKAASGKGIHVFSPYSGIQTR